jgi:hypothetical protein
MRYDAQEYLDAFREHVQFPAIHDDIAAVFGEESDAVAVCDLCCNTGLLGERLRRTFNVHVIGIEGDADAVARGTLAGVEFERLVVTIHASTLPDVVAWLAARPVNTIVARRCLSELLIDPFLRHALPRAFADLGIGELVIQGRAPTPRATHPFPSVAEEIDALDAFYRVSRRVNQCAVLRLR